MVLIETVNPANELIISLRLSDEIVGHASRTCEILNSIEIDELDFGGTTGTPFITDPWRLISSSTNAMTLKFSPC